MPDPAATPSRRKRFVAFMKRPPVLLLTVALTIFLLGGGFAAEPEAPIGPRPPKGSEGNELGTFESERVESQPSGALPTPDSGLTSVLADLLHVLRTLVGLLGILVSALVAITTVVTALLGFLEGIPALLAFLRRGLAILLIAILVFVAYKVVRGVWRAGSRILRA